MRTGGSSEYYETNEGLPIRLDGVLARYVRCYSNGSTADDLNRCTELRVYAVPALGPC